MTIERDGWLDGRPFSAVRDADTGETVKLLCLKCEREYADRDAFVGHDCARKKARKKKTK